MSSPDSPTAGHADGAPHHPDAGAPFVVEYSERVHRLPPVTRRRVRGAAIGNLIGGSILLALVLAMIVALVLTNVVGLSAIEAPPFEMWFGGIFLGLGGALMLWNAIRMRRFLKALPPGADTPLPPPAHAFAIAPGRIDFPEGPGTPAESWPLAESTASEGRWFGTRVLELSSPGRRTRRFPERWLRRPIGELVALVEERRRALR